MLTAVAVLALAVRVILRDRTPVVAVLFYATPAPVLAVSFLTAAFMWWRGGSRRGAIAHGVVGSVACAWAAFTMMGFGPRVSTAKEPDSIRLLVWNVAQGADAPAALNEIADEGADVIAFVETSMKAVAAEGKVASDVRKRMVLLADGEVDHEECGDLGPRARCRVFSVRVREQALRVVLFDSAGNPLHGRKRGMESFVRILGALEGPTVVMGDFNLPADSAWFDPLRETHRNAFEEAGRGWAGTWPVVAPVLQLDHVWASHEIEVLGARHGWSARSDHRPVVVDVRLRRPGL